MRARTAAVAAALSLTGTLVAASPAAGSASSTFSFRPAVTTHEAGTDKCPGTDQWFRDSAEGKGIAWTWTNGRHVCVQVAYMVRYTWTTCDFFFYVPPKLATAVVRFHIRGDGDFRPARSVVRGPGIPVNEEPVSGWVRIGSGNRVRSIHFTDANRQDYRAARIGWGMEADNGIKQVCGPERRRPL
ncbi:hypothetical protein ABGB14_04080 [Nonomuraea sp. B10E15]|uniref:hypothetical protein n=1 Tax=unclassified Nonomuraea TaxID=2593643 RepID=UPI00325ECD4D